MVAPTPPRGHFGTLLLPRYLPARLAHDGYLGPCDQRDATGLTMIVLSESKARRYTPGIDDVHPVAMRRAVGSNTVVRLRPYADDGRSVG